MLAIQVPLLDANIFVPPLHVGLSAPPEACLAAAMAEARFALLSSYRGSTAAVNELPLHGWWIVRHERCIGHGSTAFNRAVRALHDLEFFEHDWLTARRADDMLVIAARQFGFVWLTNANRVLHRDHASITFGTTQRHVLAGEERIGVRHDSATGAVEFEIRSLSRPRHVFAWLAYPIVVAQQRRFASAATVLMRAKCAEAERVAELQRSRRNLKKGGGSLHLFLPFGQERQLKAW